MPEVLTAVAVILIAAGIGALSLHVRTKLFPRQPRHGSPHAKEEQDVSGYVATMVSVFYALIVGLSLVAVWENRDSAAQNSRTEAAGLQQVYLLAAGLPSTPRERIQGDATAYAHYVATVEWPLMQRGAPLPATGRTMLSALGLAATSYQPVTSGQSITASNILTEIGTVDAASTGRRAAASLRMPVLLWVGLGLGGTLTVALAFVHGMERHLRHLTVVMSLTSLVGFTTILIYILNNPFAPGLGAADAFTAAFPSG
jgi:hypothetical protein